MPLQSILGALPVKKEGNNMSKSMRQIEREHTRDMMISIMEDAKPKTMDSLNSSIRKHIKKLENNKIKIQKMSDEQFIKAISGDIFGVALKGFYTNKIDKNIEKLKHITDGIETMVDFRCKGNIGSDYIEKETFKGRVKEGINLLDEFTPKKCICIRDFVKENKNNYFEPDGYLLSGGKKQRQMVRDAMRACN